MDQNQQSPNNPQDTNTPHKIEVTHNPIVLQTDKQRENIENLLTLTKKEGEEEFVKTEADKYDLPYIDLSGIAPDPEAIQEITATQAKAALIASFKQVGNKLYVAMYNPENPKTLEVLKNLEARGFELIKFMASHASLEHVWSRYADLVKATVTKDGILDINSPTLQDMLSHIKTIQDLQNSILVVANGSKTFRISRIIELIFAGAIHFRASDVHIEPEKESVRIRYRIDGVLTPVCFIDYNTMRLMNARLKLLSGVKLSITENAQDGRFSILDGKVEIESRVSIVPNNYGESFVVRLLDPRTIKTSLDSLGMSDNLRKIVEDYITRPDGLILLTGPTGSGKTTTLYAFLGQLNSPAKKIITIEDPIEYHLSGIIQTQVDTDSGYTFLSGLRAAMRQDPNIIMVGEIRDHDTAKVAINASLTGHIVFSTLHTNNAAGTIPRLLELGENAGAIASGLTLSMAQRLVRILCPHCKEKIQATDIQAKQITNILGLMVHNNKDAYMEGFKPATTYTVYQPSEHGCEYCTNGFRGRLGVFEAISMSREISDMVINETNINERKIRDISQKEGIPTMREDGIIKVLNGTTSYDELKANVDIFEE